MLARLLYLILLTLVARLVFRAVADVFGASSSSNAGSGARRVGDRGGRNVLVKGRMVRDPVCGLNVPEDRAIVALVQGETFYFCSERCRGAFTESESQKRARA